MMKIITGSTGTAHVTSNNDGEFNQSIWGNELVVFDNGEKLAASIADNNTITIADGDICLQGRHALIEPGTVEDVTIETGSVGMNRIDLIVAHYEIDTETGFESISLEVIKGNETAGTPTVPAYTEGDIRTGATVAEAPLYEVKIENVAISSVTAKFKTEPSIKESISEINNDLSELIKSKIVTKSLGTVTKDLRYDITSLTAEGIKSDNFISMEIIDGGGSGNYAIGYLYMKNRNDIVFYNDNSDTNFSIIIKITYVNK